MPISAYPIPTGYSVSTLGGLLGPLGALAFGAILIALGVIVVGLVNEHRTVSATTRMREEATPIVARRAAGRSARHAA